MGGGVIYGWVIGGRVLILRGVNMRGVKEGCWEGVREGCYVRGVNMGG